MLRAIPSCSSRPSCAPCGPVHISHTGRLCICPILVLETPNNGYFNNKTCKDHKITSIHPVAFERMSW